MSKKKQYKQKFRKDWLQKESFEKWLLEVEGNHSLAYCTFCKCTINAKYHDLIKHGTSRKHMNNNNKFQIKVATKSVPINSFKSVKLGRNVDEKDPDNLEINGEPNAEAIFISVPPAETSGSVSLEASSCESPLKNRNSVTFQPIKTVTVPSGKISEYHGSIRAEDEFDLFGKSMASHLRKMPLLAALECQSKIQSYIIQKRIEITSSSDVSIKQGQ